VAKVAGATQGGTRTDGNVAQTWSGRIGDTSDKAGWRLGRVLGDMRALCLLCGGRRCRLPDLQALESDLDQS
jgi:hypothetical protein